MGQRKTLDNAVVATCETPDVADPSVIGGASDAGYLVTSYHSSLTGERVVMVEAPITQTDAGVAGSTGTRTFALANSGVTAGTYGGANELIKSVTVSAKGLLSAITEAAGGVDYEYPLTFVGATRVGNVVTVDAASPAITFVNGTGATISSTQKRTKFTNLPAGNSNALLPALSTVGNGHDLWIYTDSSCSPGNTLTVVPNGTDVFAGDPILQSSKDLRKLVADKNAVPAEWIVEF